MIDILKDNFFSIEYFDEEGIQNVAEVFQGDYEEILYEQSMGNFFVGQTNSGRLYFFCETDKPNNEITFNSVFVLIVLVRTHTPVAYL